MQNITIYTTPYCHYCKLAKEYFKSQNLQWKELDVMTDESARNEMIQKTGQLAVPVIDINGTIVIGFNQPKIKELLGIK